MKQFPEYVKLISNLNKKYKYKLVNLLNLVFNGTK